jgi:hypothetical protein
MASEFQIPSGFSGSPGPPATLILQHQATSFGAKSKARYMKQALPKLITYLLTYLFTYLLTPWSRVLIEKLTGFAASQEIPRM